jgi:hypothetical protein
MIPAGFERLLLGHAVAIARSEIAASIRRALVSADGTKSTLHEFAARQTSARSLRGRDIAYAVQLPSTSMRVVVRHNRHGGLLAPLTRDVFLSPTRAPQELEISLALRGLGIPTPDVVAYALYPPGGLLQRSDVCSREIPASLDLAQIITFGGGDRAAAFAATARLVAALSRAGARHQDLNAKNILLTLDTAYVLDVDRVTLGGAPRVALDMNLMRLGRSLRKWRDKFGARISESDIVDLETGVRRQFELS